MLRATTPISSAGVPASSNARTRCATSRTSSSMPAAWKCCQLGGLGSGAAPYPGPGIDPPKRRTKPSTKDWPRSATLASAGSQGRSMTNCAPAWPSAHRKCSAWPVASAKPCTKIARARSCVATKAAAASCRSPGRCTPLAFIDSVVNRAASTTACGPCRARADSKSRMLEAARPIPSCKPSKRSRNSGCCSAARRARISTKAERLSGFAPASRCRRNASACKLSTSTPSVAEACASRIAR